MRGKHYPATDIKPYTAAFFRNFIIRFRTRFVKESIYLPAPKKHFFLTREKNSFILFISPLRSLQYYNCLMKKEGFIMADELNLEQLKTKAESLVKSITGDKDLLASFTKDPIGTLEKKLGIDLPDEQINQLIKMIKEKLGDAGTKTLIQKILGFFKK